MLPVTHFGLLILCSALVGCSSVSREAHWKSMLDRNEMNILDEIRGIKKSEMNVILCWVCRETVHQIRGVVLHEIKKEIQAVCKQMHLLEDFCKQHAHKYQSLIIHLLFHDNSRNTCQHLSMCK